MLAFNILVGLFTKRSLVSFICFTGPMSLISAIFGTDDDNEILQFLYLIANVRTSLELRFYGLIFQCPEYKRIGFNTRVAVDIRQF